VYDLGLTSDEVWRLTPAQYTALLKRLRGAHLRDDYRFGIVGSVVARSMGAKVSPEDLFSSIKLALDAEERRRNADANTNAAAMLAFVTAKNAELGGKDLRPENWKFAN
jgi:hypothetical protein